MSKSFRIAVLIVIFVLLSTVVGCSKILFKETQTFNDNEIQFDIPNSWKANKNIQQDKTATDENGNTITYYHTMASYLRYDVENKQQAGIVVYTEQSTKETIEKWCKDNNFKREEFAKHLMDSELKKGIEEMKNTSNSSITIGGKPGFKFNGLIKNTSGDWYDMVELAVEHNEKVYFIQYMENEDSQGKYAKELDTLLQSFKFTE